MPCVVLIGRPIIGLRAEGEEHRDDKDRPRQMQAASPASDFRIVFRKRRFDMRSPLVSIKSGFQTSSAFRPDPARKNIDVSKARAVLGEVSMM